MLWSRELATISTHSDLALMLPASHECETLLGTSPSGTSVYPLAGDEFFESSREEGGLLLPGGDTLEEPFSSFRIGGLETLGPLCHTPSCRGFCDRSAKAAWRVVGSLQREMTIHRGSVTHNEQEKYGVPMTRLGRGGHE